MTDTVFAPCPLPDVQPPTGGAQAVYVDRALLVIKGTYEDPVKNDPAAPLPKHRWALVHEGGTVFAEGTTSDAQGISAIFKPDADPLPDGTWELFLIPVFEGRSSDSVATYEEAWIDVDKNAWVPPEDVARQPPHSKGALSSVALSVIKQERLLRIPLWSTKRKAESGGGFFEAHPSGSEFADKGTLKTGELKRHGTWDKPWEIRVDHGWMRSWVKLVLYDPAQKADKPPAKGLVLQSIGVVKRHGASSVRFDDGCFYVLHAFSEDKIPETTAYAFATPKDTQMAYGTQTYISGAPTGLDRLETHYFIPREWASLAGEGWIGPGDPSASSRKPYADLRKDGKSRSAPLCFHLDDVVLTDDKGTPIIQPKDLPFAADKQRLALLDHDLAVRDPEKGANGGDLARSKKRLERLPLRAEVDYFIRGQGLHKTIRVIEHEGTIYEIDGSRAGGFPALDGWVGHRAARKAKSLGGSNYSCYLIDTRYLRRDYHGTQIRPAHLLVHVSCRLDDKNLLGSNAGALPLTDEMLVASSKVWDQAHPAHAGSGSKKDYALVPRAGVSAGSTVIKVRHFFSSRSGDPAKEISILIEHEGRAHAGNPMKVYLKNGGGLDPPVPSSAPAEVSRPYADLEPLGAGATDPADSTSERWFTLAHELGHEHGLPDEYLEPFDPTRVHAKARGFLPRIQQWWASKLFAGDSISMMVENKLPRLRYLWDHLEELHQWAAGGAPADHWALKERPFIAEMKKGPLTLRHDLSGPAPSFSGGKRPWEPTHEGAHGLCKVALYRIGDDESTVGPLFFEPGHALIPEGQRFDGLVAVCPLFWFTFAASIGAEERWDMMLAFGRDFYDKSKHPRFFIQDTSGASQFKRVAILIQPRFEYGPAPSVLDAGKSPPTLEKMSSATLEVFVNAQPGVSLETGGGTAKVNVRQQDLDRWIYRSALKSVPDLPKPRDNSALRAADFNDLAGWIATKLGRAAGKVVPFG